MVVGEIMRIAVLGAGIVGVTTAWWLGEDGHDVVLIDRADGPARETSFANAGIVSPGHANAWASPEAPRILLAGLFARHAALKLHWGVDPALWRWGLRFLANCTSRAHERNTARMLALCLYGRDMTVALERELGLSYDRSGAGALYLHRDPAALAADAAQLDRLGGAEMGARRVAAEDLPSIEPALAGRAGALAGAIHAPGDFAGDCRAFAEALRAHAGTRHGLEARFGEAVRAIEAESGRVRAIRTDRDRIGVDAAVLCLGSEAPRLARRQGVRLPIYPVKGYSLTFPLREGGVAPITCGVDQTHLMAWSRLGDRLRVTARAEFAGFDRTANPSVQAAMTAAIRGLFPDAADYAAGTAWACLRPMTPTGAPILGRLRPAPGNLWFNVGHGHLGWSMAAGTGRILADLIAGRRPALPAMTGPI